jgi:hypothetical protein
MFWIPVASAQNPQIITNLPGCDFVTGKLSAACVPIFIGHLIQVLFSLISLFFLLNVMYAGYQIALGYIRGEKTEGIERIRWSIIGLIVCVCTFLIINLVINVISP